MIGKECLIRQGVRLILTLLLVACTSRPTLSDLKISERKFVYYEGNAFNGTAWSSDGKTISITCHNGVVDSVMVYHKNGNKAIKSNRLCGEGTFYDTEGNPISVDDFIQCYPSLVEEVASLSYEMNGL